MFCRCFDALISKDPAPGRNDEFLHIFLYVSIPLLIVLSMSSRWLWVDPLSAIVTISPSLWDVSIFINLFSPIEELYILDANPISSSFGIFNLV